MDIQYDRFGLPRWRYPGNENVSRTRTPHRVGLFLAFFKKEDFVRGNDLKIDKNMGIDFFMTGWAGFWNAHQMGGCVEAVHASTGSARTASTRSNCGF